jgi:hypothetical protein
VKLARLHSVLLLLLTMVIDVPLVADAAQLHYEWQDVDQMHIFIGKEGHPTLPLLSFCMVIRPHQSCTRK